MLKDIQKISIVIPVYNESDRIDKPLVQLQKYFSQFDYNYEIIFVDDGSSDDTCRKIADFIKTNQLNNFKLLKQPENKGKGAAVKLGMLNAANDSDLYFFMDADLSTPLKEIENFITYYCANHTDVLIGSRSLPNSKVVVHQKFYREMMGKIFNKILKMLIFTRFIDTQCGFKMFSAKVKNLIFGKVKVERFAFDAEIVFLAQKYNIRISDLPVTWINKENSRVRIVKDSLNMVFDLLKLRYNWIAGKYK